jgi:hypothetical protein
LAGGSNTEGSRTEEIEEKITMAPLGGKTSHIECGVCVNVVWCACGV